MKLNNFKKMMNSALKHVFVGSSLFMFAACGATSGTSTGTSTSTDSTSTSAFPQGLSVASPFSTGDASTSQNLSRYLTAGSGPSYASAFSLSTDEITAILESTSLSGCSFDPEAFLEKATDAGCYGPRLKYEDHPDATGAEPDDGELPTGDLGLWEEDDADTGNACAAAELNARLGGVESKASAALKGLASMVCVINVNGYSMPSSSTLDLTADMNGLGVTDTTFAAANVSHEINADGEDVYSYNIEFTYAPGTDSYDVTVDMTHVPDPVDADIFRGQLSYLVNDQFIGGNCPSSDVTVNGSLQYEQDSANDLALEMRDATFCEHDTDGRDANGIVDPSIKQTFTDTGWGNNFSTFTAEFAPTTMDGNYAYSWQAGPQDANTRVFNVNVETDAVSGDQLGKAFFGYGDDIETTDGSVDGFICNWAGPGNDHTIIEVAQYQEVSYDSTSGLFLSDVANLIYAPTVDCNYDGTGSFIFDTDIDGDLSDESNIAVVDELVDGQDDDADGVATIEETVGASGFALPTL